MLLLVSGATATLRGLPADAPVGHLITPATGNSIALAFASGRPVAFDNGCGPKSDGTPGTLDEPAFLAMCQEAAELHRAHIAAGRRSPLLWVVCPDAVGDAYETRRLWRHYSRQLRELGLPLAWVAQDGCERDGLAMWGGPRAVFVGGSTDWKESDAARWVCRLAKEMGKLVHVGRVNTERRLRLFDDLGRDWRGVPHAVDSIDGTQFSRFPDTYVPRWAERLRPSLKGTLAKAPVTPMDEIWRDAA